MQVHEYAKALRARWRLLLLVLLLSLAGGAAVMLGSTPQYAATTQLFVSVESGGQDASQLSQGSLFSSQRVKSYVDIASSPRVTAPVIDAMNLRTSPAELAERVEAQAPLDTVLINLTYTDTHAARAAQVANALGQRFATVVEELERPAARADSPVKLSVTRAATVPVSPEWPDPVLVFGLALALGLVLGAATALVVDRLDTTVKRADDLEESAGLPTLGAIGEATEAQRHPLLTTADPHGPRAEAFRQLRTNLQFFYVDGRPKTITVTSALPAEGKSTTASNLALTLAQAGVSVCLIDADLRRPQLARYFGLPGEAGLTSVLIGRVGLSRVVQQVPGGLEILTSGPIPPNPSELLGSDQMSAVLKELAASYDTVVIDAPPLLPVTDAAVLAGRTDGVLLVVRAGKTRREHVKRAAELLRSVDARILGTVLNRAPKKGREAETYGYAYTYRPQRPDES